VRLILLQNPVLKKKSLNVFFRICNLSKCFKFSSSSNASSQFAPLEDNSSILYSVKWNRIILDETHFIKEAVAVVLEIQEFLLSIPCLFAEPIFKMFGQTTAIAAKSGLLLKWMLPQLFAFAVNVYVQKFLHAQSLVLPIVWISGGVLILHLIFCWITAFKLKLGLIGIVMTHNVSCWLMTILEFLYIMHSASCKASWTGFKLIAFRQLPSFLRLSIFSAIMVFLQIWYYQILIFLAGTLNDPTVDKDALSIR